MTDFYPQPNNMMSIANQLLDDFESATDHVRNIAGKLDQNELLFFYARFKQANEGPCNTPKPGFFDFQGKQKWSAWSDLKNMSKDEAMDEYVSRLGELDPNWRSSQSSKGSGWVTVSTLAKSDDPEIAPDLKTPFDWVKESNHEKAAQIFEVLEDVNLKDENGLGLLHWASDRGSLEIVKLLLEKGADINLVDSDGQTALHYACSCGHVEVIRTLLNSHIDLEVRDNDGMQAIDNVTDPSIKKLFLS